MLRALKEIKPEIADQTMHLSHGMLKFSTGKMSSRTGDVITAESLIEQVKEKILEKMRDNGKVVPTLSVGTPTSAEDDKIAEIVAIGAIKYSILRQAIGGDIIFDFDKSISFEGDSGPYLQYACVRANSVLEKAKESGVALDMSVWERVSHFAKASRDKQVKRPESFEITELEKYLYRFPEVVERAGREYAPHYIVTYIIELASIFNSFYANQKIIDSSDPSSPYKIALTSATAYILHSGLSLLGIKVPKRM